MTRKPNAQLAPTPGEVAWIVGQPGSGKTVLARALASAAGTPVLIIDSQRVDTFERLPHVAPREAVRALWPSRGKRRSAVVTPADPGEFDALMRAVRAGGDATVLVDEAHHWTRGGKSVELMRLLRGARHARASVLLTTQHLSGDVPAEALSCTSLVYVFRCASPRALDVLEREWGLDRERIKRLERFRYLRLRIGFDLSARAVPASRA